MAVDEVKPQVNTQPPPETAPDKSGKGDESQHPAWLPDRLKEERKLATNKVVKTLGFERLDELTAFIETARKTEADSAKAKEAQLTEAERLKAELDKLNGQLVEQKTALEQERKSRIVEKVENAVRSAATEAKAEIPQDILNLLKAEGKLDVETLIDDQGGVKADAVKALIDAAKKLRPNWFGRGGIGSPSNARGTALEPNAAEKQQIRQAQAANLRKKF